MSDEILTIQLDHTGQRLFSEVCSCYYRQPTHGLKFSYNVTHGEFSCELGSGICMMYLASSTSDRRWAIQYVDTVAYGPNPGSAHVRLIELLMERSSSVQASLDDLAFNKGATSWNAYLMPHHVRHDKRVYKEC